MSGTPDGISGVAPGVLMITRANVNCYLLETADGPVLVDGGLPGSWPLLVDALCELGCVPGDLAGVYLTHGHFDHVGLCRKLRREESVVSRIHAADLELARHPYRYAHERPRIRYPIRFPRAIPGLSRMVAAGALSVRGVRAHGSDWPGESLPAGVGLVPIPTPGHTRGHCAFAVPERSLLFSGDALVTYDPYTGAEGPRAVARAATADARAALRALDALEATGARLVLPGHGAPFAGGVEQAVAHARAAGVP